MVIKGKKAKTVSYTKAKPKKPVVASVKPIVTVPEVEKSVQKVTFQRIPCQYVKTTTVHMEHVAGQAVVKQSAKKIETTNDTKDITLDKLFRM